VRDPAVVDDKQVTRFEDVADRSRIDRLGEALEGPGRLIVRRVGQSHVDGIEPDLRSLTGTGQHRHAGTLTIAIIQFAGHLPWLAPIPAAGAISSRTRDASGRMRLAVDIEESAGNGHLS
jgi:hypothetical protein